MRHVVSELEQHFRDFRSFNDRFMLDVANAQIDEIKYATAFAILCLAWIGFPRNAVPGVVKSDVHIKTFSVWDSSCDKERIGPEDAVMFLQHYRFMRIYAYESVYTNRLIRTRTSQVLTDASVLMRVRNLNESIGMGGGGGYSYGIIYESGVFSRVCQAELVGQFSFPVYKKNFAMPQEWRERMPMLFERTFENDRTMFAYLRRFKQYRKKFYPELPDIDK